MKRTRIVGCGSYHRGDDETGLLAVEALRDLNSPHREVRLSTTGGADLLDWCQEVDRLILIDAALASERFPPGACLRLAYPADAAALVATSSPSTHSLSLSDALRLAETLGQLPREVVLYLLAGDCFERGTSVSPSLRGPLAALVESIRREVAV